MDNATTPNASDRAEAVCELVDADRADAIAELMEANEWTREEAEAWLDDPANQTLCEVCGWTVGMVCPECSKGCGCETSCSGWRHQEFRSDDADIDADRGGEDEGCECGAYWGSNGYGCVCQ
jgi:hypothetical protein